MPDVDNATVVDYDAVEHRIYWSDVRTQTIKRAFINGTGVETVVSAGKNSLRNIRQSVIYLLLCFSLFFFLNKAHNLIFAVKYNKRVWEDK